MSPSSLSLTQIDQSTVEVSGTVQVTNFSGCTDDLIIELEATDDCGNTNSEPVALTITVNNKLEPVFVECPMRDGYKKNAKVPPGAAPAAVLADIWLMPARNGGSGNLTCNPITVYADAGTCEAYVNLTPPVALGQCGSEPVQVVGERSDSLSLDDPYQPGTTGISWTATDDCGNTATLSTEVIVEDKNRVFITVELFGVTEESVSRCIHWTLFDQTCQIAHEGDVELLFEMDERSSDTYVRFEGPIEVPCGDWSHLCLKDEQHTLTSSQSIEIAGPDYQALAPFVLYGGDTDNDDDVDINDVTLWVTQFDESCHPGGCPWDGTRDSDFSDNCNVNIEDYGFFIIIKDGFGDFPGFGEFPHANGGCTCGTTSQPVAGFYHAMAVVSRSAADLSPEVRAKVDLNTDGVIDHRDIRIFETNNGLPHTISSALKTAQTKRASGGIVPTPGGLSR